MNAGHGPDQQAGGARVRLLALAPSMAGGGAEQVLTVLLRHLDRRRFDARLVLLRREGPLLDRLPRDIPVQALGATRVRSAWPALLRAVWRLKPDVLLSTPAHLNVAVAALRPLFPSRTRLVVREGALPSRAFTGIPRSCRRWIMSRNYPRLAAVICQSHDVGRDLAAHFNVASANLAVIPNPVDVDEVRRLSRQNGAVPPRTPGRVRLLAAGRLDAQKGFDLLVEAMLRLNDSRFELTVLGEGPLRGALEEQIRRSGLNDRCRLPGFAANPYAWMADADCFVLSSRFEGFPNAVIEAMACGTPVVAFDCPGGIRDIIEPGRNGILAPAGQTGPLAGAIRKAAQTSFDPETVCRSVRDRFDAARIVPRYEALLSGNAQPARSANGEPRREAPAC